MSCREIFWTPCIKISASGSRQRKRPALIVVHKRLGEFAAVLAAAEFVHQRVNPIKPLRVLALVGHAGGALALFDRRDIHVMSWPEHRGLRSGIYLKVVKRKLPPGAKPRIK